MDFLRQQLVYFGFLQGVFLLLIYWLSPQQRHNINTFLAAFVAVLTLSLSGRILFLTGAFGANDRLIVLSELATLLFGPTIYLFTRSSLYGRPFRRRDLWHYLPAIPYNLAVIIAFVLPEDQALAARAANGGDLLLILVLVGIGLAFNLTYWWFSLRLFLRFRRSLPQEASYVVKSRFFLHFLVAVGVCMGGWLTLYFLGAFGHWLFQRPLWQLIWLSLAGIMLLISYYGLTQPELYRVAPDIAPPKYAGSRLTTRDLDRLQLRLDRLMAERKPYLNRKLMKAELAELLGVSKPDVSRLLNERIGMNFFEYINHFRIREFITLARGEKASTLTLYGLAQEAGFNSKTTFNKAFKELMGVSPTAYFREGKREQ